MVGQERITRQATQAAPVEVKPYSAGVAQGVAQQAKETKVAAQQAAAAEALPPLVALMLQLPSGGMVAREPHQQLQVLVSHTRVAAAEHRMEVPQAQVVLVEAATEQMELAPEHLEPPTQAAAAEAEDIPQTQAAMAEQVDRA